ncbi:glycerol dehydrogenase [Fructilactobacillus fructivorans]|nr:glycerol dehydrogenase [Fructilactobacillus fructivorans]KRN12908.1 glycerol dehydrogenase [Fructilactobacillus fructivorans]KRN40870.1 glycerol dehydrogenase [Fructilactobacillus fructivorans]KRN42465.1 glycerol dehydrogenase [Fructilactobacillus fructivorans]
MIEMVKLFASPSNYVQGPDVLMHSADRIGKFGKRVLLLSSPSVLKIIGNDFAEYLKKNDFDVEVVNFTGESSESEIDRVTKIGQTKGDNVVIGLGGGKVSDSAKAIADNLNTTVVIAPTIASTDAPCSRLSVIYTDNGQFDHYRFYKKNPDMVILDTKVISHAPVKFLIAGMADAMATNVEATDTRKSDGTNMLGGKSTLAGESIGQKCEQTLFKYGSLAVAANVVGSVTPELDNIVEANTLLSGIGFESGGLAAAHAIYNGFTALSGEIDQLSHGQKVAFGTLCELVLTGSDHRRFEKYLSFDLEFGLPTTLEDLKLGTASDKELMRAATQACDPSDTMVNLPVSVTPIDVMNAMKTVSEFSHEYQVKNGLGD